jgi:hypothetical protein
MEGVAAGKSTEMVHDDRENVVGVVAALTPVVAVGGSN